jgi:glycosyltransferase involved in cell wall biosynthesis
VLKHGAVDTNGRKKRFVLLFDDLQSVHLFKDVGQVPFQMYKQYGYDAEIVCRRSSDDFPAIDGALKGLKITAIDGSPYRYLVHQARHIDVLMLMHISTRSACRGILYKFLHPGGCLYIKADQTGKQIDFGHWVDQDFITHFKRVLLRKKLIQAVDTVSFETRAAFVGADAVPAEKRLLLPNGFDPDFIERYRIRRRVFEEKENLVLLVGRHGDPNKNTELMLDALEMLGDIGEWNVQFVGPMTPEFEQRSALLLKNNPRLAEKVFFAGQIDEKRELFELYNRAKILCLTSRRESWGMVCVEALCFGNALVMTDVDSSADLTGNGQAGIVIPQDDRAACAEALLRLMNNQELLENYHDTALRHFEACFVWKNILKPLAGRIAEKTP